MNYEHVSVYFRQISNALKRYTPENKNFPDLFKPLYHFMCISYKQKDYVNLSDED